MKRSALAPRLLAAAIAAAAMIASGCGGGDSSTSTSASPLVGASGASGAQGVAAAGEVQVTFEPPSGSQNTLGAQLLKAGRLPFLADKLSEAFALPEDLTVQGVNGFGGGPFFNPKDTSITYPYGFSALVYQTLSDLRPEWSQFRLGEGIAAVNSFIFEHEFAHALVAIYDLPVLGREEDAADDLATLLLLQADGGDQFVFDAAQFWAALSDRQSVPQVSDYADVHSLDLQRAFSMLCEMAGSSPAAYREVARLNALPTARLTGCPAEYKEKVESFEQVLGPHLEQPLDLGD